MIRYQYLTISTLSINCCSQPYLPIAFPFCCTVIVLLKKNFRHIWKTIFFLRCRCHLTNLYKTRFTLPERPTCRMGYASGRAVWIGHKWPHCILQVYWWWLFHTAAKSWIIIQHTGVKLAVIVQMSNCQPKQTSSFTNYAANCGRNRYAVSQPNPPRISFRSLTANTHKIHLPSFWLRVRFHRNRC